MSQITDLTGPDDGDEVLTRRSIHTGLFGREKKLVTTPLETHLTDCEEPKYVLRNKKAGLEIKGRDGSTRIEPADEFHTLALVTDLRLVFVAGQAGGDEVVELPLADVVEAKTRAGRFRSSSLVLETVADETWRFGCKSDTTPVSAHIDEMAQVWAHSQRLLDDVEKQLSTAKTALDASEFSRARSEIEDAETTLRTAVERIEEVGPGATANVEPRVRKLSQWLQDGRRKLWADVGASAHAQAQSDWRSQAYEAAAGQYERALEAYERALSTNGRVPREESLDRRLTGALRERELLRIGPLVDADTERRRALEEADPERAAAAWEAALEGYREMLTLDWGKETGEFVVDRDLIRAQTVAVADDAIEDHLVAGRQWLHSGDKLAVDGLVDEAQEVYRRAHREFNNAEQLSREVRPEHLDTIEEALNAVDSRLAGWVPETVPDEYPFEPVTIAGQETDGRLKQSSKHPHEININVSSSTASSANENSTDRDARLFDTVRVGRSKPSLDGVEDAEFDDETLSAQPPADSAAGKIADRSAIERIQNERRSEQEESATGSKFADSQTRESERTEQQESVTESEEAATEMEEGSLSVLDQIRMRKRQQRRNHTQEMTDSVKK